MIEHGYPAPRVRPRGAPGAATDIFPRHQATGGFVTLGDADATIIGFSGRPERVEVFVELNDAILTFAQDTDVEEAEITIRAGIRYEPGLPCRRVLGRNATAGLNARVQVVGKWVEEP